MLPTKISFSQSFDDCLPLLPRGDMADWETAYEHGSSIFQRRYGITKSLK
jgi:hypothetical protein